MTRIITGMDALGGERRLYGRDHQWFVHQRMQLTRSTRYNLISKPLSVRTILHEVLITMCLESPAQHGLGVVVIGLVASPNPTDDEIELSEPVIRFQEAAIKGYWFHEGCGVTENWNIHKTVLGGTKHIVIQIFQDSVNDIGLRAGVRFQEP